MSLHGFFYLRDNEWFLLQKVLKGGITTCIKHRNSTYVTGEVISGVFILVIAIELKYMRWVENQVKLFFIPINKGGGTEFYDRVILYELENFLQKLGISYRVLGKDEIECMCKPDNDTCEYCRLEETVIQEQFFKEKETIKPNDQQLDVLSKISDFYKENTIGWINWACGLGKTLLYIFIVKEMNWKSIVIGVPNINLMYQMKSEILKVFPNSKIKFLKGNEKTPIKDIKDILKDIIHEDPVFIITTYHSCHYIVEDVDHVFSCKIGDEAHHLTGKNMDGKKSCHVDFHKIRSNNSLFGTATAKIIDCEEKNFTYYSMDDKEKFGKVIDKKSVKFAIENKKITDYSVVILKNSELEVDQIIKNSGVDVENKELFLSCMGCVKSIETYNNLNHILLYTNNKDEANLCEKYIDEILSKGCYKLNKENTYNKALYSGIKNLNNEIKDFTKSQYGIIPCIYIFSEGFDLPELNGVCFGVNMESKIRIVQSLLRPNRIDKNIIDKLAYYIIPIIDDDWENGKSIEKLKTIIVNLRCIDDNIEHKLTLSSLVKNRESKDCMDNQIGLILDDRDIELDKIKLRLRHGKILKSKNSEEQDEYDLVKLINKELKLQTKEEYIKIGSKLNDYYIKDAEEYFKKKCVWKNWTDFLGIDTSKFIYYKDDWLKFCLENKISSLEMYNNMCTKYDILPKNPEQFYKDFTNIPNELSFQNKRRK